MPSSGVVGPSTAIPQHMRLGRHARYRLRWIQRAHPAVSERALLETLLAGRTLGYDERGHRRGLVAIGSMEMALVIDDETRVVITLWMQVGAVLSTYDADADVLYVLPVDEGKAVVHRTEELGPNLRCGSRCVRRGRGEFLYPRSNGVDPEPVRVRYGLDLKIPFSFAA